MLVIFASKSCRFRANMKKNILTLSFDCKKGTQAGQRSVNAPVLSDQPKPGYSSWRLSHTNVFGSKMVVLKPKRLCSWHEKWLISCCHSCPLPKPQAHAPITLRGRGRVTWFLAGPGGTAKSGEGLESHKWQRSTELLTEPLKIPSTFFFHKTVMHMFSAFHSRLSSQWFKSPVKHIYLLNVS